MIRRVVVVGALLGAAFACAPQFSAEGTKCDDANACPDSLACVDGICVVPSGSGGGDAGSVGGGAGGGATDGGATGGGAGGGATGGGSGGGATGGGSGGGATGGGSGDGGCGFPGTPAIAGVTHIAAGDFAGIGRDGIAAALTDGGVVVVPDVCNSASVVSIAPTAAVVQLLSLKVAARARRQLVLLLATTPAGVQQLELMGSTFTRRYTSTASMMPVTGTVVVSPGMLSDELVVAHAGGLNFYFADDAGVLGFGETSDVTGSGITTLCGLWGNTYSYIFWGGPAWTALRRTVVEHTGGLSSTSDATPTGGPGYRALGALPEFSAVFGWTTSSISPNIIAYMISDGGVVAETPLGFGPAGPGTHLTIGNFKASDGGTLPAALAHTETEAQLWNFLPSPPGINGTYSGLAVNGPAWTETAMGDFNGDRRGDLVVGKADAGLQIIWGL